MTNSPSKTILCDFDGTISRTCLCDFLYGQFASCGMKYTEMWTAGKIGTREEIDSTFQYISASREEMEKALDIVELVPGFSQFYNHCREAGDELIIVSDGLEWAIRYMIAKAGVTDIRVMANRIFFEEQGYRFEFPYFNPVSPKAGVHKLSIARKFKDAGQRVYLIGDGRTDFEATQAADFVFARDALWDYCRENGIPSFHYEDFFDILDYVKKSNNP